MVWCGEGERSAQLILVHVRHWQRSSGKRAKGVRCTAMRKIERVREGGREGASE